MLTTVVARQKAMQMKKTMFIHTLLRCNISTHEPYGVPQFAYMSHWAYSIPEWDWRGKGENRLAYFVDDKA